jgi:hypothetical protein
MARGDGGVLHEAPHAAAIRFGAAAVEIEPALVVQEGDDVVAVAGVAVRMARFAGELEADVAGMSGHGRS